MPSPSAKSIATMIIATPTARPRMTRSFSKPFETLLNKGAAAQIPPMIRRIAVETTIGIECVSYRRRGLSRLLRFLCSGIRGGFLFGLDFRHYEGLFGKNFFLNFRR